MSEFQSHTGETSSSNETSGNSDPIEKRAEEIERKLKFAGVNIMPEEAVWLIQTVRARSQELERLREPMACGHERRYEIGHNACLLCIEKQLRERAEKAEREFDIALRESFGGDYVEVAAHESNLSRKEIMQRMVMLVIERSGMLERRRAEKARIECIGDWAIALGEAVERFDIGIGFDDTKLGEAADKIIRDVEAAVEQRTKAERDQLRERAEKAEEQVHQLKTMSTVEMMCENENVNLHVREWEARCLKAEAELKNDTLYTDMRNYAKQLEAERAQLRADNEAMRDLIEFVYSMPDNDDLSWWLESLTNKAREVDAAHPGAGMAERVKKLEEFVVMAKAFHGSSDHDDMEEERRCRFCKALAALDEKENKSNENGNPQVS